jgi:lysophospholipase L1-like esterase
MYTPETPYDTLDDFHPNADGMKTLAEQVLRQIPTEF